MVKYVYMVKYIYICIYIYIYVCVFNQYEFPDQTISRSGTIDPNIWFLACFCIAKMVDPKHRLGEMFFQPTFLSSISTVFSHQKVIPEMYIYIYIYMAFRSLGRIVGKHPCQKCTNQHPATHTLPSARGTEDFVNNIDF